MENKKTLIATGAVVVLLIVLIIGGILFLFNFIRNKQQEANTNIFPSAPVVEGSPSTVAYATTSPSPTITVRPTSTPKATPKPTPAPSSVVPAGTKTYTGNGFQLFYPQNWGLLTCSNSQNIEFDPLNSTNQLNYKCDYAIKPITILVHSSTPSCPGSIITLGGVSVIKSVTNTANGTTYRWCTKTSPSLDITNRVSATTQRAYSTKSYASEIEQMISQMHF